MKSKSFTLIELIIIVGIVAVLSGIFLGYYNNFSEEKKLDEGVKKLIDVLNLARTKSLAADLSPQTTCTNFAGYKIEFIGNTYDLIFCCNSSCTGGGRIKIQSYGLPSSVSFLSSSTISFKPLSGETSQATTTITLKNTNINQCYQVTVQASGLVDFNKLTCP